MNSRWIFLTIATLVALLIGCRGDNAVPAITLDAEGYGRVVLDNGVRVVINQDRTTSLSAARIVIGGGVLSETAETNGITNLMVSMLLRGNSRMNAEQITDRLDYLGATVTPGCFADFAGISISVLTENLDSVLAVISASLTSPTFPADELAKLKEEVLGAIKAANDNQTAASSNLFWKTAFGSQGYGLPYLGTEESIGPLTVDQIRSHYEKYVGGRNIVFSIATDLPEDKIVTILERRIGVIKQSAEEVRAPEMTLQTEKSGFVSYDRNQSFIFMGYILDRLEPGDMACLTLLHRSMGAGVGSRLWDLRQKEKLAYAVYTQYLPAGRVTLFRSAIGTDTSKVKLALQSLEREWSELTADGLTEAELADARVNMKNSLIYGLDRKAVRANNMAFYEYLGYGYRFLLDQIAMADQISLEDVNGFAKSRLTSDRKYRSIVGKQ